MSESGVIYECYKGILLNLTTFHQNLMSSVFFYPIWYRWVCHMVNLSLDIKRVSSSVTNYSLVAKFMVLSFIT